MSKNLGVFPWAHKLNLTLHLRGKHHDELSLPPLTFLKSSLDKWWELGTVDVLWADSGPMSLGSLCYDLPAVQLVHAKEVPHGSKYSMLIPGVIPEGHAMISGPSDNTVQPHIIGLLDVETLDLGKILSQGVLGPRVAGLPNPTPQVTFLSTATGAARIVLGVRA